MTQDGEFQSLSTKINLVVGPDQADEVSNGQPACTHDAVDNPSAEQASDNAAACAGTRSESCSENVPATDSETLDTKPADDTAVAANIEIPQTQTSIKTIAKGSSSYISFFYSVIFFGLFLTFLTSPFLLPERLWAYDPVSIFLNSAHYSFIMAFSGAAMSLATFALTIWFERRSRRNKPGATILTVPMQQELAFELCMAGIDRNRIQRAREDAGEITIQATSGRLIDVSVKSSGENSSQIEIRRRTMTPVPCLFWRKELEEVLNEYATPLSCTTITDQLVAYIEQNSELYAGRTAPSPYRIHVDYERPMPKKSRAGWALLALIPLYPLMMLFFADNTPSELAVHARYEKLHDSYRALKLYDKALALAPDYMRLYGERAELYLNLNQPANAEADYRKALSLGRDNKWLLYGLQSALIQQGKLDEVLWLDNTISSEYVDTADVLNNRAWDEAITGNPEAGLSDSNKAITQDPKFYAAYGTRGYAYHLLGNDEQAIADYTTAIALNPADRVDHFLRAQALRNLGQSEAADRDESRARELGFNWPELAVPPTFDSHGDPPQQIGGMDAMPVEVPVEVQPD